MNVMHRSFARRRLQLLLYFMLVKRNEIRDVRGVHRNNNAWRNAPPDTFWSIFPLFRRCKRYTSWYRSSLPSLPHPLKRLLYLNVRFAKRLPSIYICPVFHMIFLIRTSNAERIFSYFSFPPRWEISVRRKNRVIVLSCRWRLTS